jgi:hypothetical protein
VQLLAACALDAILSHPKKTTAIEKDISAIL